MYRVGVRQRQAGKSEEPRDELDDLIDGGLDELDFVEIILTSHVLRDRRTQPAWM